jgi:hypothetical protein
LKAKDVRSIEDRFVELLASAPGSKVEKQAFFREQLKTTVPRGSYGLMWGRLIETLGPAGAGEAVFDYVISFSDERLRELLTALRNRAEIDLRLREPATIRRIFYRKGNLRPIGARLFEYIGEREWPWESVSEAPLMSTTGAVRIEGPSTQVEYHVALSFAGEQRPYVERVANRLDQAGITYFYDAHEEARMWGKDLASFLDEVFRTKARYCVMFVSKDYARKSWPTWEGKSAIARSVAERQEYVLPVRFDQTEFPGLKPTIKYLDARRLTPEQIAAHIIAKLSTADE